MEKTREELMQEMMNNIKDQKADTILDEIALPNVNTQFTNKRVNNEEEG